MIHLYRANGKEDFENFFIIKSDPSAVLWSGFDSAPDRQRLQSYFEDALNDDNMNIYYFLSDDEDKLVGYGQLNKVSETDVFLSGASVLSDFQGKGHSKRIFNLLVEEAGRLGFSRVLGACVDDNVPSTRGLVSSGFTKTGEFKNMRLGKFWEYEKLI